VRVPWAEQRRRYTLQKERLVIDLILQCITAKNACAIAAISRDEAWDILQRAKRPDRLPTSGSMRSHSSKVHRYHPIVCDLERSTVEFLAEDRKTASLAAHYEQLTDSQKSAFQAVAMDIWQPCIGAPCDHCDLLPLRGTRSMPALEPGGPLCRSLMEYSREAAFVA
jgi:transposase